VREPVEVGEPLGEGVVPSCNDTVPPDPSAERIVRVRALTGISPNVAVAIEEDGGEPTVWLAPGYPVEHPAHPLHDRLFGGSDEPDEERGLTCEAPVSFQARAATTPGGVAFRVVSDDEAVAALLARHDDGSVSIDAQTAVSGLDRDGLPYLEAGDEFRLTVRGCSGLDGVRVLVAKTLSG
jgi:hypothetical protein